MKQLFIALVLINLGYPLLQRLLGVDSTSAAADEAEKAQIQMQAVETAPAAGSETPTFIAAPGYADTLEPHSEPHNERKTETLVAAQSQPDPSEHTTQTSPRPGLVEGSAEKPASEAANLLAGQAVTADAAPPASDAPVDQCVIAGPFRRKADAEALVNKLAVSDIGSDLQPRDTALLPDYMVYVGPEASEAKARALVAAFAARNVDSHLIGRGNLKNALSLGVFSRGPLAISMRDRLRAEGHNANIATMSRNRKGFQVRTSLPQSVRDQLVESDTPLIDCPLSNVSAEAIASAKSVL